MLTTDSGTVPVVGRTVTFTLGSGASAQKCSGTTSSSGAASCVIAKVNQTMSPAPVTAAFAGDNYYAPANASGSVAISTPTSLSVTATTSTYGQPTTLTGTLTNSVTGAPLSGQTVVLTLNGTQTCTATTNASGMASCSVTPTEPSGTYTVSGTYADAPISTPVLTTNLLPSSGSNTVVVNKAPTTLTYTGQTSIGWSQTLTLSSVLKTSSGTPIAGQTVVETLGSGRSAQSCTAVTNSSGVASCTVQVNQVYGSVSVTVSYGGDLYLPVVLDGVLRGGRLRRRWVWRRLRRRLRRRLGRRLGRRLRWRGRLSVWRRLGRGRLRWNLASSEDRGPGLRLITTCRPVGP